MADLRDLAIRTAEDVNQHAALIAGKANIEHVHTAEDITAGTLAAARLPAASTSARGGVQLATNAEATAGTNTAKAVTPAGLKAKVDPLEARVSTVEAGQGGSSLTNVMVTNGVPTGSAPVGFWAIDATTGDYYQME
ncbi:hypothetical protein [Gulosibacter faecalis]|uniref:Uncharacterized protein n=1 Tax=Gulosibacter faecalis TaxID=272240 RepID=A0ABW5UUH6_9MICO|nr:hypothetical protein [Gulosibacter faecalis]